jgi:hypothetical protein
LFCRGFAVASVSVLGLVTFSMPIPLPTVPLSVLVPLKAMYIWWIQCSAHSLGVALPTSH